eukprot:CAMPEP_0117015008 /NCGR_PEP_ID=MMETSP0472-20121206/12066_1 /TAXON_ID=693140 ORGANISM="Tiarina fusus, Strain LIS" /NCGR_SAMPLE_ID=MMETSP0472 /ASSEMBLY_ACC=CAM_ASM_000603 /LENGTH=230 /DNA_ID=CAMNT_0004718703 /DNA_START=83 /DNA_END=775 /DNA_ORIENTATION=+
MTFVPKHSPTIVNNTRHTIVVFQERGTLFNKQVLRPGEAVSMTRKQTGGNFLIPYKVHAVIGDESALPTGKDSVKNLVKVTAIPAAFVTGCLVTAVGAGMLIGPSAALAPLVSGMVVNGVVVDATAIAAGGLLATRAQAVTDMLLRDQPDKFMCKTGRLKPGARYLVVKGGLSDGPVVIEDTAKRDFNKLTIAAWKEPQDNSTQGKIEYIADEIGNGEEPEVEVNMIEAH